MVVGVCLVQALGAHPSSSMCATRVITLLADAYLMPCGTVRRECWQLVGW